MNVDNWKSPFSIKIMHDFLDEKYYCFMKKLIEKDKFYKATQGVNKKQIVQEENKIRLDYTLDMNECAVIDKPFVYKADCNCNLRERWRLLFYDGDSDKKPFRDAHKDWTAWSCHRRMSIIIGLSNPDDYEGGELYFKENNLKYKIEKGTAIIFDSKLVHEVLPLSKGKRYVIQAFLFDDSGYDLRKEKPGKNNYILLGNDIDKNSIITKNLFNDKERNKELENLNTDSLLENIKIMNDNKNWIFLENKNMVHSRLSSVDDCFIGEYKFLSDLIEYLNNNKNIVYFTWHNCSHHNKKWKYRAYGWTQDMCIKKQKTEITKWPYEKNVLSGYSKNIKDLKLEINEISNSNIKLSQHELQNKYLTVISTDGGPGNQIVGIKEAILMSKMLNRKLLFPPIIQHYVLNRVHRGGGNNNIKYWKFSEIFEYKDDNIEVLEAIENKHIIENTSNQYFIRKNDMTNPLRMEKLLELKNKNKKLLNVRNFKNLSDYNELKGYEDEHLLTITQLYNSTAISKCFWNGCDTCEMNPVIFNLYKDICSKFHFSQKIKEFGEKYINETFGKEEFVCLHLRYSDYGDDKDLKDITKLYNESDINNLIIKVCEKESISNKNVFVATSNQKRLLNSDLKVYKLLPKNIKYDEIESFIEQYIAIKSKIFIYSGGLTDRDKGNHEHKRSTWASFVIDYRSYLLNKEKNSNIYLTNRFS